ncbi:uncharacterized protein LOC119766875 [Culex quinquefasciatus]|uniref:uncharacterized protein LOC119766872 n=1 Tax=Culex quinquefasciatus TaxID=7176 RepID=UPI0018E38768|nr:uncharacterized protein LOC119766872 [Culex quinquefasciatus]XP_038109099.1 uncharacterized protein LOC119766875 [Culex quinquefasciatus]
MENGVSSSSQDPVPRPNLAAAAVPANEGARWQQPIRGGFLDAGKLIEMYLEKTWFRTRSSWRSRKRPASKLQLPSSRTTIRYRNVRASCHQRDELPISLYKGQDTCEPVQNMSS